MKQLTLPVALCVFLLLLSPTSSKKISDFTEGYFKIQNMNPAIYPLEIGFPYPARADQSSKGDILVS
jgi:hypothetical protein